MGIYSGKGCPDSGFQDNGALLRYCVFKKRNLILRHHQNSILMIKELIFLLCLSAITVAPCQCAAALADSRSKPATVHNNKRTSLTCTTDYRPMSLSSKSAKTGIISETPEGTLISDTYCSSKSYWVFLGMLVISDNDGFAANIVIDGNDMYVQNLVSQFSTGSWIHGTLDGNVLTVEKQPYALAYDANGNEGILSVALMRKEDNTYVVDGNGSAVFQWQDGVLTGIENDGQYILGLVDDSGNWAGYGDFNIMQQTFSRAKVEHPEDLPSDDYTLMYEMKNGTKDTIKVRMASDSNDVYIGDLSYYAPDIWIKGTRNGNVITIPSNQYLGVNEYTNHHIFFFTGIQTKVWNEEYEIEITDYELEPDAEVSLTFNDETLIWEADKLFLITGSYRLPIVFDDYSCVTFKKYDISALKAPAAPEIIYSEPLSDMGGIYIAFNMPNYDTDGNYLEAQNLYFSIYNNDEDSVYEFPAELFWYDQDDYTLINYGTNSDFVYASGGAMHELYFSENFDRYGIRDWYMLDGKLVPSEIVWIDYSEVGIETTTDKTTVKTEYFNLQGLPIDNPQSGIYILRKTYNDGKSGSKIVRR